MCNTSTKVPAKKNNRSFAENVMVISAREEASEIGLGFRLLSPGDAGGNKDSILFHTFLELEGIILNSSIATTLRRLAKKGENDF